MVVATFGEKSVKSVVANGVATISVAVPTLREEIPLLQLG